jgi:hypothetical protein
MSQPVATVTRNFIMTMINLALNKTPSDIRKDISKIKIRLTFISKMGAMVSKDLKNKGTIMWPVAEFNNFELSDT